MGASCGDSGHGIAAGVRGAAREHQRARSSRRLPPAAGVPRLAALESHHGPHTVRALSLIRGDMTYYKAGWLGNHEFGTGFFVEPRNVYDQVTTYTNDGFFREYRTVVDVNNPAAGTRAYRRDYATPVSLQTRSARDSNYAFYLQDSWRPNERLTANIGMRFDYVKRVDLVRDITRQRSWARSWRCG